MKAPRLHIEAGDPLEKKVRALTRFLGEDFFHESGIMYAMWYWKGDDLRPFRASDFEGMSVFKIKAGTRMEDLYGQENSPTTSGLFLWSQALRYQATKEEEGLRYAAKAFRSLELIFEMGEANGEFGMLCKPYGFKFTHETSPDQYVPIAIGMWEYRKFADEATGRKIDRMLPAMADWWRKRDYKLVYFDHEGDWLYHNDARSQYGPLYVMMHLMAHRITGHDEYRKEGDRILELIGAFPTRFDFAREQLLKTGKTNWPEKLHGYEYDPTRRPYLQLDWENQCAISLPAESVEWLILHEPSLRHMLQHAMGNYYRHIKSNLTPDLLSLYWTQTDLETGQTYPVVRPRISTDRKDYLIDFDWNIFAYASKVCLGEAGSRITDVALLAHRYAPGFSPGALTLAKAMLAKLDNERLLSWIDPDGKQLMPEDRWLAYVLSSETPGLTVLDYWRAKSWGIQLEDSPA